MYWKSIIFDINISPSKPTSSKATATQYINTIQTNNPIGLNFESFMRANALKNLNLNREKNTYIRVYKSFHFHPSAFYFSPFIIIFHCFYSFQPFPIFTLTGSTLARAFPLNFFFNFPALLFILEAIVIIFQRMLFI